MGLGVGLWKKVFVDFFFLGEGSLNWIQMSYILMTLFCRLHYKNTSDMFLKWLYIHRKRDTCFCVSFWVPVFLREALIGAVLFQWAWIDVLRIRMPWETFCLMIWPALFSFAKFLWIVLRYIFYPLKLFTNRQPNKPQVAMFERSELDFCRCVWAMKQGILVV